MRLVLAAMFSWVLPLKTLAWDSNIVTAYQLELFRNDALTLNDYKYMAQAILLAKNGLSLEQSQAYLQTLSEKQIKEMLKPATHVKAFRNSEKSIAHTRHW